MEFNGPGSINPNAFLNTPENPEEDEEEKQKRAQEEIEKRARDAEKKSEKQTQADAEKAERRAKREKAKEAFKAKQAEKQQPEDAQPDEASHTAAEDSRHEEEVSADESPDESIEIDNQEAAESEDEVLDEAVEYALRREDELADEVAEAEASNDGAPQKAGAFIAATLVRNFIQRLRGAESGDDAQEAVNQAEEETLGSLNLPNQVSATEEEILIPHEQAGDTQATSGDTEPSIHSGDSGQGGAVVESSGINEANGSTSETAQVYSAAIPSQPDSLKWSPSYEEKPKSEPTRGATIGGAIAGAFLGYAFGKGEQNNKQNKQEKRSITWLEKDVDELKVKQAEIQSRVEDTPRPPRPFEQQASKPEQPTVVESLQRSEQKVRRIASDEVQQQKPQKQQKFVEKLQRQVEAAAPQAQEARQSLERDITKSIESKEFNDRANAANEVLRTEQKANKKDARYLSLPEAIDAAKAIPVRGTTLKELYQRGHVSERSLRKIVELKSRGFDVRSTISEVINMERREMLKSQQQLAAAMTATYSDVVAEDINNQPVVDTQEQTKSAIPTHTDSSSSHPAGLQSKSKSITNSNWVPLVAIVFLLTMLLLFFLFR